MPKKFRRLMSAFFVSSNNTGKKEGVKKIPEIKPGKLVAGHKVGRVFKENGIATCFSCETCRGAIVHPFNEQSGHFDVHQRNPLPH